MFRLQSSLVKFFFELVDAKYIYDWTKMSFTFLGDLMIGRVYLFIG